MDSERPTKSFDYDDTSTLPIKKRIDSGKTLGSSEDPGTETASETSSEAHIPSPAPASTAKEEEKTKDAIQLSIVHQNGEAIYFKLQRDTKLGKLMNAYHKRMGTDSTTTRFLFDGSRINPEDTPASRKMEDKDVIDAMQLQVGG